MKAVRIAFDEGPQWPAFDTGREWNGWIVPVVTAGTRDAIAAYLESLGADDAEYAAELRDLPIDGEGHVVIDLGYTFNVID